MTRLLYSLFSLLKKRRDKTVVVKWADRFRNTFTIERCGDTFIKSIQTDKQSQFMFLGDVYSRDILLKSAIIKTYCAEYHNKTYLMRDIYNRLIVCFYDDEMRFGSPDREEELWIFANNEDDADRIAAAGKFSRHGEPFIAGDETPYMSACHPVATESVIDIGSRNPFPANVLSNLYPSQFILDGIRLKSMEGFLQSLKTPDRQMQKKIRKLYGKQAKRYGDLLKDTFDGRHIFRKGKTIDRFSDDYPQLLCRAYRARYKYDTLFRTALEATAGKPLVHTIGKQNQKETILTEREFISCLDELRKEHNILKS
jgi:hypothetical protein